MVYTQLKMKRVGDYMASLECWNCNKMFAYDKRDNLTVVASSEYKELPFEDSVEIDMKCPRCKKHNIITAK